MTDTLNDAMFLVKEGTLRVTPDGQVWRMKDRGKSASARLLPRRADSINKATGYRTCSVFVDGRGTNVYAHRLVWNYFNGPIPSGLEVNHKDRDKSNNHPDNLEVISHAQNIKHGVEGGASRPWSRTDSPYWRGSKLRLTAAQCDEMVRLRANGMTYKAIGERVGVKEAHAGLICRRAAVSVTE